jgi:hypothetical protein
MKDKDPIGDLIANYLFFCCVLLLACILAEAIMSHL